MVRTRAGAATGADAVTVCAALPEELLLHVLLGLSAARDLAPALSAALRQRSDASVLYLLNLIELLLNLYLLNGFNALKLAAPPTRPS
jgi:hypothetical protein